MLNLPMRALHLAARMVCLLASCVRPETSRLPKSGAALEMTSPSQAGFPLGYSLTDTTRWGNVLGEEGDRAVLRRRGIVIDTVDINFGILFGGKDSLVFLPVRTDTVPFVLDSIVEYQSGQTEHVLWTPGLRRELRDILPFFDSFFSSPTIVDKPAIYYWESPMTRPGSDCTQYGTISALLVWTPFF